MQHRAVLFQTDEPWTRNIEPSSTPTGDIPISPCTPLESSTPPLLFEKITGRRQEVAYTRSRRAQPREWLRAINWLVDNGLHPKHWHPLGQSTARLVAQELARRMDYRRGLVLYDLKGTAARLKMSESNLKRHVSYLRELGALVWLEHGSKRNLHLPGRKYTATATIYAAAIPPVYDTAKGHRLRGEGYEATVIGVTEAGRRLAVNQAVENAAHTRRKRRLAPPSRGSNPPVPKLRLSGEYKTRRGTRTERRRSPRSSILGRRVTAALYQASDRLARRLRPKHSWTQRAQISELSWVLIDKIAEGYDEQQLHQWLGEISPTNLVDCDWRPQNPHMYIASQLRHEAEQQRLEAERRAEWENATGPNDAFVDALAQVRAEHAGEELPVFDSPSDMDEDTRAYLRQQAWSAYKQAGDPSLVTTACEFLGSATAIALFGAELVSRCLALAANRGNPRIRLH